MDRTWTRTLGRARAPHGNLLFSRDRSRLYLSTEDRVLIYRTAGLHLEREIPLTPRDQAAPITELADDELAVLNARSLVRFDPRTGERTAAPLPVGPGSQPPQPSQETDDLLARPRHPGQVVVALGRSLRVWQLRPETGGPRELRSLSPPEPVEGLTATPDGSAVAIEERAGDDLRTANLDTGATSAPFNAEYATGLSYSHPLLLSGDGAEIWFAPSRLKIAGLNLFDGTTFSDGRALFVHQAVPIRCASRWTRGRRWPTCAASTTASSPWKSATGSPVALGRNAPAPRSKSADRPRDSRPDQEAHGGSRHGRVVSMPLEGGGEVLIEASDDAPGDRRVGRGNAVERATETMQDAMGRIRPAAQAVLDEFRARDTPPAKVNVQFGIEATGEASLAVAKTAGGANFTVTLERDDSTPKNA